ncbi:putative F-box protein [Iris pallida]|uniref:F-box protein n=1 Tax=Iris pallida TaxID=29817 RepID=A0AAX6EJZ9_IRIPA|nr:putative F-box protein [Iris pallida]
MGNLSSRACKLWRAAAAGGGRKDWAGLPDELVGAIAERLSIPDRIRFRAVCTSWASAAAAADHPPSPSRHPPWLMLDDRRAFGPPQLSFASAGDGRSYRLPGARARACVGSRDGRLVLLDSSTSDASLVNPVTGARASLPSFRTLPWSKAFFDVRKVALSSAAAGGDAGEGFVALSVVYSLSSCHLAFARAGDEEWTPLDFLPPPPPQRIEDVAYHDGKFFVVFTRGRVQTFDLAGASPAASRLYGTCALDASCQVHLVSSSCNNDLLQVRREKEVLTGRTTRLQVMKFVPDSDSGWVEIKDLGDQSLFLDDKHSVSLRADDSSAAAAAPVRKNCIYFADDVPHSGKIKVGDLRTFDVGKSTFEPFRLPGGSGANDRRQLMAPIWFIPSLLSP